MPKKSRQKNKYLEILRRERAFKMKEKAYFIIFEGLSLKEMKKLFLVGESPTLL